jgi:hypothetical protein
MAVPKNDKHKDYASYAEHCLREWRLWHQIRNIAPFSAKCRLNG